MSIQPKRGEVRYLALIDYVEHTGDGFGAADEPHHVIDAETGSVAMRGDGDTDHQEARSRAVAMSKAYRAGVRSVERAVLPDACPRCGATGGASPTWTCGHSVEEV